MLSIIVCSKNEVLPASLEKNIQDTVGVPFELIVVDNSTSRYSIFSAYNEGLKISKFPYVCFVHDDVLFKTGNWGENLINHFKEDTIGFIGVAGGDFFSEVPCSWSESGVARNFIQSDKNGRFSKHILYKNDLLSQMQEVILLDGVFLASRRSLFDEIIFDEISFKGFHAYDVDICLQAISKGHRNYVVFDVLLEHFSEGKKTREWVTNIFLSFEKWKNLLPLSIPKYSEKEFYKKKKKSLIRLLRILVRLEYSSKEIRSMTMSFWKSLNKKNNLNQLSRIILWMKCSHFFRVL